MNKGRRDIATLAENFSRWACAKLGDEGPVTIERLASPEEGASSETYLIDLSLGRGAQRRSAGWVLRVEPTLHQVYEDPSVERQYRALQILSRETDAPVPQVYWYEGDPGVIGAPFFVMERLEGRTPTNEHHSRGLLIEKTPAERQRMLLNSLEALARLDRADPGLFAFLGLPEHGDNGVDQELGRWDSYIRWGGVPDHPTLLRTRRWLEANKPRTTRLGVAWGDARLGNVLFQGVTCVALLDWETASLGGAETDLGWWLGYDRVVTEVAGAPRLEGLGSPAETLAAWESFAGRKLEAMEWHEVFGTYRLAIIMERAFALSGNDRPPDNPAIRALTEMVG
ncbi:MAG: phosphotransferase family protein [Caulobacteraceae bacterium]|nr:phosphotransferase family protein [Caulobacteraceae bacterium]